MILRGCVVLWSFFASALWLSAVIGDETGHFTTTVLLWVALLDNMRTWWVAVIGSKAPVDLHSRCRV